MFTKIKKFATIGLVVAMMAAMTVTAMAGTDSMIIRLNGGYADCFVSCNFNNAYASTQMYASYDPDYIYLYIEMHFEAWGGSASDTEYIGVEADEKVINYGRYGSVSVEITGDATYYLTPCAYSYHEVEMDEYFDYCNLHASY